MKYRIAGIDVHKRMLAVVIADVAVDGEFQFERRKVGTSPSEMCRLAEWLVAEQVEEVVMETTAQYWRRVWATLEQQWRPKRLQDGGARSGQLHLEAVWASTVAPASPILVANIARWIP